ncbi:dockerin type I repeat-containing protein [bacterium]|nr:dockerin type I repeat-containing protein [bacterium]
MKLRNLFGALVATQCVLTCSLCAFATDESFVESGQSGCERQVNAENSNFAETNAVSLDYRCVPVTTSTDVIFEVVTKHASHITTSSEDIFSVEDPVDVSIPSLEVQPPPVIRFDDYCDIAVPPLLISPPIAIKPSIAEPPVTTKPVIPTYINSNNNIIDKGNDDTLNIDKLSPDIIVRVEEYGDLDGNKSITATDASYLLQAIVNGQIDDLKIDDLKNADFNQDGRVNALDASVILKYIVEHDI